MRDWYSNGIIAGAWVEGKNSNFFARYIEWLIDVRFHLIALERRGAKRW
jgi:hypothetical protein